MTDGPPPDHLARTSLIVRWSHQAFELLRDLEQVAFACADNERYLRLVTLLREHNVHISGRQYVICRSFDSGRGPLMLTPSRSRVLRSPAARGDPYPVETQLLDEAEALAAEGGLTGYRTTPAVPPM